VSQAQHEITKECEFAHCWIHGVDEDGTGAFRICLECNHVYATGQELVDAYNEGVRQVNASPVPPFPPGTVALMAGFLPVVANPGPVPEITSPDEAWFCPLCVHDF
jgi:hypothetical protein